MRTVCRNPAVSLLYWAALFAAMFLLFERFAPDAAEAFSDESLVLTVLTEDGPVSMTMAEYLPGAVAAEMPVSFGPEALKAQAVAARTYVLASRRHSDGDICTDSGCCIAWLSPEERRALWGADYPACLRSVTEAVTATDGQYLTYGGEAIQAVFHASSAGATEDSAAIWAPQPYLVSVESPETAETVPGLISTANFSPGELRTLLGLETDEPPETWSPLTEPDNAGRVKTLHIGGRSLTGAYVRSALGLRSTDFSVSYADGAFVFTVAGYGHGVGMSQYGAMLLAGQGWSYDRILEHYYPGTVLEVL
ncbi:MAG: stage II sporulation protein D [Oscillospiraceae bacterium]|nr:stage II sporulation protein D [Oscillospiraceae bacterium]